MNSDRMSRQQRIIMELLYDRYYKPVKRVNYYEHYELIDAVRTKIGLGRVSINFASSFARSIRNLLFKHWIDADERRLGRGRGYFIRMFYIKITDYGTNAVRNRAVR